jgi:hypothetical protein
MPDHCGCEDIGCSLHHGKCFAQRHCEGVPVIRVRVYNLTEWLCAACFEDLEEQEFAREIEVLQDNRPEEI